MRIAVFGATGKTGLQLVDQALGRGWSVVAAVRHPGPLTEHDGLTLVEGDVLDPAVVARACDGADAVLSALGFRRHLRGPSATTVYSDSARTFVDVQSRYGPPPTRARDLGRG